MIKLYDSAFSPFARKVRMALEYKSLNYEAVDGLLKPNHQALRAVLNVPMLHEDELVGVITIFRQEVRPFTEEQISLVKNFAAQAGYRDGLKRRAFGDVGDGAEARRRGSTAGQKN